MCSFLLIASIIRYIMFNSNKSHSIRILLLGLLLFISSWCWFNYILLHNFLILVRFFIVLLFFLGIYDFIWFYDFLLRCISSFINKLFMIYFVGIIQLSISFLFLALHLILDDINVFCIFYYKLLLYLLLRSWWWIELFITQLLL